MAYNIIIYVQSCNRASKDALNFANCALIPIELIMPQAPVQAKQKKMNHFSNKLTTTRVIQEYFSSMIFSARAIPTIPATVSTETRMWGWEGKRYINHKQAC